VPSDTLGSGILSLVWNSGPIAKVVLLVLMVFSIVSWALIVEKTFQFRRVRRQTLEFLKVFREARRPSIVHSAARRLRLSPLAQLYFAAYQEISGIPEVLDKVLDDFDEGLGAERLEAVNRALRRSAALEVARLEHYLPFLATTASATPFIGLFGTVWGVMALRARQASPSSRRESPRRWWRPPRGSAPRFPPSSGTTTSSTA
jgi:biopolymer transport protein TolQ